MLITPMSGTRCPLQALHMLPIPLVEASRSCLSLHWGLCTVRHAFYTSPPLIPQRLHFTDGGIAQSQALVSSGAAETQTNAQTISQVTNWRLIEKPWLLKASFVVIFLCVLPPGGQRRSLLALLLSWKEQRGQPLTSTAWS